MDPLDRQNKQEFVRQQMSMYHGLKVDTGDMVKILCPFHSEKTPSGAINVGPHRSPGFFHCFGCGKNSSWDDLAPLIGLEPYRKGPPKERFATSLLMAHVDDQSESEQDWIDDRLKFWDIPRNKIWRSIPTNLLIDLGGRMCRKYHPEHGWGVTKFLYFPVRINGDQRGYFRARLKKHETESSYYLAKSSPGSNWSKRWGLWPFDYALDVMKDQKSRTMVLVEGQRDALRLLMNNIPAMCIFGTQSWSTNKPKLLELAGVERVVSFFDGDCAGIKATENALPDLRRLFETKVVKLWSIKGSPYAKYAHLGEDGEPSKAAKADGVSLWDPGNCPQWIIDQIRSKYV